MAKKLKCDILQIKAQDDQQKWYFLRKYLNP